MNKLNIFIALLITLQVAQVLATGSGLAFNVNKASAYLNAGNCYVNPGYTCASACNTKNIGVRYYNLPYGWKQYQDKLYIPNLLSQKGEWTFGAKVSDGSESTNQLFKVALNGLSLRIAPATGSDSNSLVIGSNYRTKGVTQQDWKNFVASLTSGQGYFQGTGVAFWFAGKTKGTGKKVNTTVKTGLDNLFGYNDDIVKTILIGTPSQVTITTTTTTTTSISSDAKQKAIDAQYAANRALDDINALISQLTTSISSGTVSFDRLTQTLTTVKTTSSQCNDKILQLSTTQTKSQTDIDSLNVQIQQAKAKLNDVTPALNSLISRRDELVSQRNDIERAKSPKADELTSLQTKFTSCNSQVDGSRAQFSNVQSKVQNNNDKINTIKADSADAPNQVQLATQQLSVVVASIAQLQAKLNQARAQKTKIEGDITNYNNLIQTSNTQIQSLESQNSNLNAQITSIQSRVDSKTVQCSGYQTQSDNIRSQLASQQSSYDELNKQIQVQQTLIADKRNQISSFQAQTNTLPSKLIIFQNDLTNTKTALQRQYSICSQTTQAVTKADSQLKAVQLKLQTQKKFLSDAQGKLASVIANKKAADDAVTKILGDISKYNTVSTVSSSSSSDTSTSTNTKNIRGGISGVATSTSGSSNIVYATGPIAIGNIADYLTKIYGKNLKDGWSKFSGPKYSTMYPASKTTVGALYGSNKAGIFLPKGASYLTGIKASQIGTSSVSTNLIGDFSCGSGSTSGSSGVTSGYGKIISVQPGYITCSTNSGNVNLRIGGCSRLQSNKPDYVYTIQDNIFWRGLPSGGSSKDIHAYDITCLA